MSDQSDRPDPWAPPEGRTPQDKVELSKPAPGAAGGPTPPPVHDQPTMTGMPGAGGFGPPDLGAVPPPPTAPGGPATPPPAGGYGYPTAPTASGYGHPGYPGYAGYGQPGWPGAAPANGMGITAMVLGICATVGFCAYGLGIILGILALIFGIIGRKRAQRGEATNSGMAVAGIVLGSIGMVVSAAFLAFIIWAIVQSEKADDGDYDSYSTSLVVQSAR
ncbi:DUF4190 domain-containing protein [Streptomyces purpureus]|uniref:DUF4190 domain-containing protein n=1 Tax=Streptomyces purpureus TaxID=1951 RepID=A0A918LTC6_9ACTN|nr:DUF4190 domain-containing protein [Streptomyces purpureus]GGT49997.1 hypothetical protein GCM10014713_50110 [Streptomyces purpureus]